MGMRSDQTLRPDLVEEVPGDPDVTADGDGRLVSGSDTQVTEPAKLIRIATMTRSILEEVREATPDESGRDLISRIHDRSLIELRDVLSEHLLSEFDRMFEPLLGDDPPHVI